MAAVRRLRKSVEKSISRHSKGGVIHCSRGLFARLAQDFPTKVALSISYDDWGKRVGDVGAWGDGNVKMRLRELPEWVMEVESGGAVRHVLMYPRTPVHDGALSSCLRQPCAVRTVMED